MTEQGGPRGPGVRAVAEAVIDNLAEGGLVQYVGADREPVRVLNVSEVARSVGFSGFGAGAPPNPAAGTSDLHPAHHHVA